MTQMQIDEMARAERREYSRKWRAANKDKVKQHNQNYWIRRAQKLLAENEATESGEQEE